jgi:hypothetical protein
MYDHRYTPTFKDCVQRYQNRPDVLAALSQTLTELALRPFGNPRLQTHAVKKAQPNTFTSYVTNQGHRLIWRRVGNVVVLLLFGEHDAVYRRAERLRLEIDDSQNMLRVIDEDPRTGRDVPYVERRADEGRLFMAWTDAELAGFGFHGHEIGVLRRLNTDQDLTSLDGHMRPEAWQLAMNLAMYGAPDTEQATPDEAVIEVQPAAEIETTTPADESVELALRDPRRSPEFVSVPADELAEVLSRPIEDWMVYLDPAQQDLVERTFSGPARIRGAAGTGKTVVALHRARALARIGRRVLVTTYVRNLPDVYQQLFARFAPAERSMVEFSNVHRWAWQYLRKHRAPIRVDPKLADQAWRAAYREIVTARSPLRRARLTAVYLHEEVEWVIRGRALPDLDSYLGLERTGRGTPLSKELRGEVWRLAERYAAELADRGLSDFTDVLLRAHELVVQRGGDPEYGAVIVDEAQDLTEAALKLVHALVGDQPNGLLLVGDGQQSIYPGGFNLATIGVQVRGRSHVLTRNYRNTKEIYAFAHTVLDARGVNVAGDTSDPAVETVDLSRTGPAPTLVGQASEDEHDLALAAAVEAAVEAGTGIGDLAVLVPTNALADRYTKLIDSLGLPAQPLGEYDGTPNALAKVGTYQRAKGLEFKQVFLPRLDADGLHEARRADEDDTAYAERMALLRRQLFVAMTRARDSLWIGFVGSPTALLPSARGSSPAPTPGS